MRSLKHITLLGWIFWLVTVSTGLVAAPACVAMQESACPCCEVPVSECQDMTCLSSIERPALLLSTIQVVAPPADQQPVLKPRPNFALLYCYLLAQSDLATRRSFSYLPTSPVRDILLLVETFRL